MATAVIFNSEGIDYFVLPDDVDVLGLNMAYINDSDTPDSLADKLSAIFYDPETGEKLRTPCSMADFVTAIRAGADMIECGFNP